MDKITDVSAKEESEQGHYTFVLDSQKFHNLLLAANIAVWKTVFATRQSTYSEVAKKTYGLPTVMDNVPQSVIDNGLICPESRAEYLALYEQVKGGAKQASAEVAICVEGKKSWMRINMVTDFEDGKPVSAIGVSEDITQEKQLLLRVETAAYRRRIYEANLICSGYFDLSDGTVIDFDMKGLNNNAINAFTHYDALQQAFVLQIPDVQEQEEYGNIFGAQHLRELFAAGSVEVAYEYKLVLPSLGAVWVRTKAFLLSRPGDKHTVAFVYTTNIEKEKRAQVILNLITCSSYDRIICIDMSSGSYESYAHVEKPLSDLPTEGDNYWQDVLSGSKKYLSEHAYKVATEMVSAEKVAKLLNAGKPCSFIPEFILPDGSKHTMKVEYKYLDDSHRFLLMTSMDITMAVEQEKQQKELLGTALAAAKQASSAKSDFLSRMSHEIRTPMNAILGMCTLAQQALGKDEEVSDCLAKIGLSGRYLLSLINDILDMSRIESGKMLLRNTNFLMSELVQSINPVVVQQSGAKHIDYEVVLDSNLDEGYIGDAMKLEQIALNLLGNAVKFTPEKGKITFCISLVSQDSKYAKVRFSVNDTGCGIREDAQKIIFEPFEQADSNVIAEGSGTGLGLPITKSLAELMGGFITLRSIVGIGSEFVVEVPLQRDPNFVVKHKVEYSFSHQKALVVDDDVLVCEQAVKTLTDIGMVSEWVASGKEAVEVVRTKWDKGHCFDYILVDWKMPEMDGIETSRRIRAIVGPDVTIIIMTAYDWVAIEKEAKAAGVNLLISKPMFKSTLISAFERAKGVVEEAKALTEMDIDFAGKRFLLAEDHPLNAEITMRLLQKKHAKVELAHNGIEAMEKFTSTPPGYYDLILMDVRMPIMDGITAARNIRHWNKVDARIIPIIAMTANALEEDVKKTMEAGMNGHLAKPVDPDLLYRAIYRHINKL